ncbi:Uncharacterised protein [Acinetobacter baumannii]|nr:Uncharacterised protein [Acinetobacter baumannii]
MNAQPQRQIEHVVAVLHQDVAVPRLAIRHRRAPFRRRQRRQHRGGNGLRRGQIRRRQGDGLHRRQRFDAAELRLLQRLRLPEADRMETDAVARLHLPHFPQFGLGDGHRADEAAETRPVAGQDHREVAGEVDGADGVLAIVHVGRMQTGLAAVLPRPLGLWPRQAHPEAVGVVMHLPVGGEKGLYRFSGEKVRRAVRPVQHTDVPLVAIVRDQAVVHRLRRGDRRRRSAGRQRRLGDRQHVRHAQGAPGVAAELAQREGGAAAEIYRHVKAVAYRQIGAATLRSTPQRQYLPGPHRDRPPVGDRLAIEIGRAARARQRDGGVAVKAQRRPLQGKLQPGGRRVVADDAVGQPKREVVHRAGRRHADVPIAEAAGIILHAAVGAGLQHFEAVRLETHIVQQARPDVAALKLRRGDHLPQIVEVGGDAVQTGRRQRHAQFFQRLRPIGAVHDQLGDHRIVKRRHFAAGRHPTVETHVVREMHLGQHAGAGLEVFQRIFGVEAHLDRRALRRALQRRPIQRVARRHLQHACDQIQAGDHFGDRVLDL